MKKVMSLSFAFLCALSIQNSSHAYSLPECVGDYKVIKRCYLESKKANLPKLQNDYNQAVKACGLLVASFKRKVIKRLPDLEKPVLDDLVEKCNFGCTLYIESKNIPKEEEFLEKCLSQ